MDPVKNKKITKIPPEEYSKAVVTSPGVNRFRVPKICAVLTVGFPEGITRTGLVIAATIISHDIHRPVKDVRELTVAVESNLYTAYAIDPACPVCLKKKRVCSKETRIRLKGIASMSKNRISRVTPVILAAIQAMPGSFTVNELYGRHPELSESSTRAILSLLRKEKEFTVIKHVWHKTDAFGDSSVWSLLIDPRGIMKSHNHRRVTEASWFRTSHSMPAPSN